MPTALALVPAGACRDLPTVRRPVLPTREPTASLTVGVATERIACRVGERVAVPVSVTGVREGRPTITVVSSGPHAVVESAGDTATLRCASTGTVTLTVSATVGAQWGTTTVPVVVAPRPQTLVLFATPKMLPDFDAPGPAVARFLDHYEPLIARSAETIVIFAVGNSEHILTYKGRGGWSDTVQWAHATDGKLPAVSRTMRYTHLAPIVQAFKAQAASRRIRVKVFDQVDPGDEFTWEFFKFNRHPECMDMRWRSWDVRQRLKKDDAPYASRPTGIPEGTNCGEFMVDQIDVYMKDFGFDGILYGNQLGTRGRWLPDNGPGWSREEESAIREFLAYSRRVYGERQLMWFDSYNNQRVERETFSFPSDGYRYFDYLMAAGFCVVTDTARYLDNLRSKLQLQPAPRVIATLDYVDPWYTYNSMTAYPEESARLEAIAIEYRDRIDGLVFFANDEVGQLVPRRIVESFATRFFGPR